jgi:hypothetical protein
MKNNHNDLINKYLDSEIDSVELNELNDLIKKDSEFKLNFSTYKYVHENLYDIPVQSAPHNITENIMSRIISSISVKYKKSYFFRVIISMFVFMFLGSLFLFFLYALNLPVVQQSLSFIGNSKDSLQPLFTKLNKVLTSDIFKTISAAIGFIILVAFYFTLNSFKNFKERLKQF